MKNISKFDMFCNMIKELNSLLICPICNSKLVLNVNSKTLICDNKHTFNISKQGFCTLIKNRSLPVDKHYTADLFSARRKVILSGFFDPVIEHISAIVNKASPTTICDLGSGEGSITNILSTKTNHRFLVLDLSKCAIKMSSDYVYNDVISLVSDLNFLPIQDNSIDMIINFLSPINPKECNRVLRDNGVIIKVIPTKNYLQEIRETFNINEYREDVLDNLKKSYIIQSEKLIEYTLNPDKEYMKNILAMTPLMSEQKVFFDITPTSITVSLKVLVLTKR